MNSPSRILLYVLSALALPGLNFFCLALLVLGLLPWLVNRARQLGRLLRRTRWLFLLLFLGYAYARPGPAAMDWLGEYAPSLPGVMAGGLQTLRLVALLALLDLLVLALPPERLLAGLYELFRPLRPLGLSAESATVRLGLTLQAMEQPASGGGLARLLDLSDTRAPVVDHVLIHPEPWGARELLVLSGAALGVMAIWFTA